MDARSISLRQFREEALESACPAFPRIGWLSGAVSPSAGGQRAGGLGLQSDARAAGQKATRNSRKAAFFNQGRKSGWATRMSSRM